MLAYHFNNGKILRDGRPIPPLGETLVHSGEVIPCRSGLHASEHPLDALQYAPGLHLDRVILGGEIVPHGDPVDKHAAGERTRTATIDATNIVVKFADWCAERAAYYARDARNASYAARDASDAASNSEFQAQRDYFLSLVNEAFDNAATAQNTLEEEE